MKNNIKYILVIAVLALINVQVNAQNDFHGSWIIPVSESYYNPPNPPVVNYERSYSLLFDTDGLVSTTLISDTYNDVQKPDFSGGAYKENGELDFYILSNRLYFNNEIYDWLETNYDDNFNPDFKIIPVIESNDTKYDIYYSFDRYNKQEDDEFHVVRITTNGADINIGDPTLISGSTYEWDVDEIAFALSNLDEYEEERVLFYCIGANGLYSRVITNAGIGSGITTLLDYNDIDGESFQAYNLELKDGNFEEPTIAWITSPDRNTGSNGNTEIHFYYDGDYELISVNLGIIGGIEFSKKDSHILYASTQDNGIVAINWESSIANEELIIDATLTPDSDDFTHTYLQTAPDGNIYGVSDDGRKLGQISMDPNGNGDFSPDYYDFPDMDYVTDVAGTYRLYEINNEYVKYFVLPDNEEKKYNLYGYTPGDCTGVLCHACDASINIHVHGGVPNYNLTVTNGEDNYFSDHFTYDDDEHIFYGTELCEGTYYFTVTDSDNPASSFTSSFTIENWNTYDFADNILEIDHESNELPSSLSDMIWDENDDFLIEDLIMFEKGFKLKNNTTLTVNNLNLEFDKNASVYIEAGSKLILNSTVLTNYHCDTVYMWNGVYVEGDNDAEQTDENMGVLEMNNSTIEFAKTAVTLHDANILNRGGIIRAVDSYFKNNRQGILFYPYHNIKHFPSGDVELDNVSYLRYCTFVNDGDYLDTPYNFTKFIRLWNVKGIKIKKCDFNSGGRNGIGIDAFDAGFNVSGNCDNSNGCTPEQWDYSEFIGFDKAIYTRNAGNPLYSVIIQHALFDNSNYGIYMDNIKHLSIIRSNNFKVGNNQNTKEKIICGSFMGRGIHIQASTNFFIENNAFSRADNVPENSDVIGILAMNNPSDNDIIYNNTFTDLKIGNQAYGNNRFSGNDPWGIEYQCNENTNNKIDFEVIGDQVANSKIHPNMGFTDLSAHNTFTSTSFADLEWHWRNMGIEQENYYLYSSELGTEYEPANAYIETTNGYNIFVKQVASGINQCPDNDGIHQERTVLTPEEQQDLETEYAVGYSDYQAVETIYNDLKDGGSTEGTSLTISSAQPEDTWELRDNLLGKSPHLSREVLEEASNRTDVLPNSVLLDILAANPDELKKEDFIQYLENKEEPLPNYMIDILRELSTGTTYKTVLVNQMALHKRKQVQAANRIIKSLINEEEQDFVAIKNWLVNKYSLIADIQIAGIFIKEDNYTDAITLLNLIPETYNLQNDALSHYLNDKDYMLMEIDLKQNNRSYTSLTTDEIAQLEIWADGEKGMARSSSRIILENFYGYDNYCDCIDRDGNKSSNADEVFEENESPLSIKANPNPATHYVEFTYELSEIDKDGIIIITDINGKQIQSFAVKYSKGVQAWDTRKIPAGAYIYTLKTKYFENSGKLIIQ